MSSASPQSTSSRPSKKVIAPKVWKRPHSTIYGKNVEFGNSLYSDKIGELNGRKFNSELPWTMRNSGTASPGGSYTTQGYLSNRSSEPQISHQLPDLSEHHLEPATSLEQSLMADKLSSSGLSYAQLLDLTNPLKQNTGRSNHRSGGGRASGASGARGDFTSYGPVSGHMHDEGKRGDRIDFYEKYADFDREINDMTNSSLLMNEPLLSRKTFDNFLDFDPELGLFLPNSSAGSDRLHRDVSSRMDINTSFVCPMLMPPTTTTITPNNYQYYCDVDKNLTEHENHRPNFGQSNIENNDMTKSPLLKQKFHLSSSPYGQSLDGRKLSLSSINPQSYRPSLPQKTTTAHASDGEEVELHDRSSPFYTDR